MVDVSIVTQIWSSFVPLQWIQMANIYYVFLYDNKTPCVIWDTHKQKYRGMLHTKIIQLMNNSSRLRKRNQRLISGCK